LLATSGIHHRSELRTPAHAQTPLAINTRATVAKKERLVRENCFNMN